jgi:hypothetical protein
MMRSYANDYFAEVALNSLPTVDDMPLNRNRKANKIFHHRRKYAVTSERDLAAQTIQMLTGKL